jgi:glutaredoxin-like protein
MPLLDAAIRTQVRAQLESLPKTVTLHMFTQELECSFCRESRQLVEELAETVPDQVKMQVHNFTLDKAAVDTFKIDKIPAIAVVGEQDYGIRFYGIPGGYEFTSLLLAIKMVGTGDPGLSQSSKLRLGALTKPVRIKVYVTPTCPYCPTAVHAAHKLAMASPFISAEMIESVEFPQLANKDQVMAVPKTVVEGMGSFEGALPEPLFVEKIVQIVTGGKT